MLKAYLHPKKKPNDRRWYAYDVVFDGEIIVADSRDPEHDFARALLARGIKGNVTLHDGPTRKPRTVVNIVVNCTDLDQMQKSAGSSHSDGPFAVLANFRFGSLADITARFGNVRFTPNSGHSSARFACPLCANNRHRGLGGRSREVHYAVRFTRSRRLRKPLARFGSGDEGNASG